MEDVPLNNLQKCLNCLVSIEMSEEETYQGRVEQVVQNINLLVLSRPFKNGRPILPADRYPLFIQPDSKVEIVEHAQLSKTNIKEDPNTRFRNAMSSLKLTPQKSAGPSKQPAPSRSYTALELLNRAQAKNKQNGAEKSSMSVINVPVNGIQGLQLLQRPQQSQLSLSKLNNSQKQQPNGGPSGNPIMDLLSGHACGQRKLHEFDQPVDMEELNQDFDFCGNLALFQKKDCTDAEEYPENKNDPEDIPPDESSEYYRVVYEDKSAPNFRHDENILSDPKRVNSWVNKTAKTKQQIIQQLNRPVTQQNSTSTSVSNKKLSSQNFALSTTNSTKPNKKQKESKNKEQQQIASTASNVEKSTSAVDNNTTVDEYSSLKLKANAVLATDNGALLPVLRKNEKLHLLAAANRLYNGSMFSCIVADRFTQYVFELHQRLLIKSKEVLIIAGMQCDAILLHRFTQYFYNREHKIYIYDPPQMPGLLANKVIVYKDVNELPTDLPAIYLLCAQTFHSDEELRRWILRQSRPSQFNMSATTTNSTQKQSASSKSLHPRIIALDFRLFDVKHMHTLYLGAADESVTTQGRLRHNSGDSVICTFEAVVADLGTPYSWISHTEATPADAFRTSLLCRLATS